MRLIDADAAIDRYYAEYEKQEICDGSEDRDWLKKCIDEAPTIEAEPVRHRRWLNRRFGSTDVICSECCTLETVRDSNYKTNYCPNCGAKMDGGNK